MLRSCEPVQELGPRAGVVVIGEVCQPALPGGDHPVQENTCYARLGRTTQSIAEDFMARRRRKGKGSRTAQPNTVHPDAAGLDLGQHRGVRGGAP